MCGQHDANGRVVLPVRRQKGGTPGARPDLRWMGEGHTKRNRVFSEKWPKRSKECPAVSGVGCGVFMKEGVQHHQAPVLPLSPRHTTRGIGPRLISTVRDVVRGLPSVLQRSVFCGAKPSKRILVLCRWSMPVASNDSKFRGLQAGWKRSSS